MLKCHMDTKIMAYAQIFWQGNNLECIGKKERDNVWYFNLWHYIEKPRETKNMI
jgi:hypothetical protein